MKLALALLLFSFLALASLHAEQIGNSNYTVQQANATLQSDSQYIQQVNESGYLFFWPNLTSADADMNRAYGNYTGSPDLAVFYANRAYDEAQTQLSIIDSHKEEALPFVLVFTVIFAVLLLKVAFPINKKG